MIKPTKININDLITEINAKLGEFRSILVEASKAKSEEELPSIILMYSPEEWEQISITIQHYNYAMEKWHLLKTDTEKREWCEENAKLFAYIRDMVASWHARIEKDISEA